MASAFIGFPNNRAGDEKEPMVCYQKRFSRIHPKHKNAIFTQRKAGFAVPFQHWFFKFEFA
jgi:hypothetical protein